MFKRSLAMLAAILMVLPAAACANDTKKNHEYVTDEYGNVQDILDDENFNGEKYIIFGSGRTDGMVTANLSADEEAEATTIPVAQNKAREIVEERFNVNISYESYGDDDASYNLFTSLQASGETTYAVGYSRDNLMIGLRTSGLAYNMSDIEQFDFSAPWWTKSVNDLAVGDYRVIASSFLSYSPLWMARMLFVNKDWVERIGEEMPYDKVFAGEWYLDDLLELAAAGSSENGDGEWTDADKYGWSVSNEHLYTFQASLGVNWIVKDENNIPRFNDKAMDVAIEYLEKMEPTVPNHIRFLETGYGYWNIINQLGMIGYCPLRETTYVTDTAFTFGFLPAPKLNENQEDYVTSSTDVFWAIPILSGGAKADFIGTITEALQCQNYNYVRPAFFDVIMKGRLADSPEDAKVLDIIPRTLTMDLDYMMKNDLLSGLMWKVPSNELASTVASEKAALEKEIADLVAATEKLSAK